VDQSQQEFVLEIEELIENVFADLDLLRTKQQEGPARRRLLESIFRRVHSIKGSSASIQLVQTSDLAHGIESLLDGIRGGRVRVNDNVLDALEHVTELLARSIAPNARIDDSSALRLLHEVELTNKARGQAEKILQSLPSEIWQSLTEEQRNHLAEILEEGWELFVVAASFAVGDFDQQFHRLRESLEVFGEVVATHPSIDPNDVAKITFRLLCVSRSNLSERRGALGKFENLSISRPMEDAIRMADSRRSRASALQPARIAVTLDLTQLDSLISSSNELFRQTTNALEQANAKATVNETEITRAFLAVQEKIINLRMVSLGRILKQAERAGRAAARNAGKQIDFETVGLELKLDKLLAEAMASPLIHLVRNAVDHGIETASERSRLGKPERGLIRIEAVNEASLTTIRVADDGRGIDPEFVSRTAFEAGLIPAETTLDLRQSLRLIFRPGFSTVRTASTTSGRGVGLDAVETAVEEVGGDVRVSTEPGYGAKFEINLPMTFGLMQSTVVVSDGCRYCLDADKIVFEKAVEASQLHPSSNGGETICESEKSLPVVRLRKLLGQPQNEEQEKEQILVCQLSGDDARQEPARRVALIVDEIQGTEPVLTRSLGSHAGRWYGIAGATELRDGAVALVLDLPRLITAL
jgi:two-component system chemotaxis sensor kinase CheA